MSNLRMFAQRLFSLVIVLLLVSCSGKAIAADSVSFREATSWLYFIESTFFGSAGASIKDGQVVFYNEIPAGLTAYIYTKDGVQIAEVLIPGSSDHMISKAADVIKSPLYEGQKLLDIDNFTTGVFVPLAASITPGLAVTDLPEGGYISYIRGTPKANALTMINLAISTIDAGKAIYDAALGQADESMLKKVKEVFFKKAVTDPELINTVAAIIMNHNDNKTKIQQSLDAYINWVDKNAWSLSAEVAATSVFSQDFVIEQGIKTAMKQVNVLVACEKAGGIISTYSNLIKDLTHGPAGFKLDMIIGTTGYTGPKTFQPGIPDNGAPTISASLPSGTYYEPQTISLQSSDSNANIYYTLDGTEPGETTTFNLNAVFSLRSTRYTTPFTISKTATLKFRAVTNSGLSSTVGEATYILTERETVRQQNGPYLQIIVQDRTKAAFNAEDDSFYATPGDVIRLQVQNVTTSPFDQLIGQNVRAVVYLPSGEDKLVNGSLINGEFSFEIGTTTDGTSMPAGRYHVVCIYGIDSNNKVNSMPNYALKQLVELDSGISTPSIPPASTSRIAMWGNQVMGFGTLTNIKTVAAGGWHNLALKNDGTVVAWGTNYKSASTVPSGLVGVISIAAGFGHSLAVKNDGTVVAWGDNVYSQSTVPTGLNGVTAVAAGYSHSLALKEDGTVVAWGNNYYNACNIPVGLSDVIAIAAGNEYSLALKSDGTVVAWGSNSNGSPVPSGLNGVIAIAGCSDHYLALKGDGTVVTWGSRTDSTLAVPAGLSGVTAIAAGGSHSLAVKSDGTVVAWGNSNFYGQASVPTGLNGVTAVFAGLDHNIALKGDGTVVAWGSSERGQSTVSDNLDGVISIASRADHSLALKSDGSVVAWGYNGAGQSNVPMGLSGVTAIAAGDGHSLALKNDGTVIAWGANDFGQRNIPAELRGVTAIAAGSSHSLALKNDGTVVAWGQGGNYQTNVPADLNGVIAIAAGDYHSLALKSNGTVVAWGLASVPAGLNGVIAIAAGYYESLALKDDGTVVAWGGNSTSVPADLSGVIAIAAGYYHSLALKNDGTVVALSLNGYVQEKVPEGLSGVKAIASGYDFMVLADKIPNELVFTMPKVTFVSENLPDGSYQIGTATKAWRFKSGANAISGLRAIQVSADSGLGISQSVIFIGDVAANTEFLINIAIDPVHDATSTKSSIWKLIDGNGEPVIITNSKTGQFWLKIKTNRDPEFSQLQLVSVSGQSDSLVSLPMQASDPDGDNLIYSVVSGGGDVVSGIWQGKPALLYQHTFPASAQTVYPIVIQVDDGHGGTARFTIQAVIAPSGKIREFYKDTPYPAGGEPATVCDKGRIPVFTPNIDQYQAIHYLTLKGIVIGTPDTADPTKRNFDGCSFASQAEALAMIMKTAAQAGLLDLDAEQRWLPNLVVTNVEAGIFKNYSWAAPYVLKAEALGMIPSADTFDPAVEAKREWLATLMARMLSLGTPVDAIDPATYLFADSTTFSSPSANKDALAVAYFGYMLGEWGSTVNFKPTESMVRADVAMVASKILRRPVADALETSNLTTQTLFGKQLPSTIHGQTFNVTGVINLNGSQIVVDSNGYVSEGINNQSNFTTAKIIMPGNGVVGTRLVNSLIINPVIVPTVNPDISFSEERSIVAVLEALDWDSRNPVRNVVRLKYGVIFPDVDGDGVRDNLDIWSNNPLFSSDANGNGIPDNADALWNLSAINGSQTVNINGQDMTMTNAILNNVLANDNTAPTTTISPASGIYTTAQIVTLIANETATIRCTTDGSTPTVASPICSTAISVNNNMTINYFAVDLVGNQEAFQQAVFSITPSGNGVCGSSNGNTFKVAPAANLCNVGTASAVTGSGSWKWTCVGTSGGTTASCTASIDQTWPTLTVSTLSNGAITNNGALNVSGNATDVSGIKSVTVNNNQVTVDQNGNFSTLITLTEGSNEVSVIATDNATNTASNSRSVTYDKTAPKLTVTTPADNSVTSASNINITGTIDENSTVSMTVNGGSPQQAQITNTTDYSATVNLDVGTNDINITATDLAGNSSSINRNIISNYLNLELSITEPPQGQPTLDGNVTIIGTVIDIPTITVKVNANNIDYYPTVTNGNFSQPLTFTEEKLYPVTVTATDLADHTSTVVRNILYSTGQINIHGNPSYINSTAVTLDLAYYPETPHTVGKMQFFYNNIAWTTPEIYAATKAITLPAGDGKKDITVRFFDETGTPSIDYTASVILDTAVPVGSVSIENGAAQTNNLKLALNLLATDINGVTHMKFSEDGITWGNEETYQTSYEYTLKSTAYGTKKVYVKFKDASGKWSAVVSDTILYQPTPLTTGNSGALLINDGAQYTTVASVKLTVIKPIDADYTQMSLSNNGTIWSAWVTIPTTYKAYTLPAGDGVKTVYVKFRTAALNQSTIYSDTIITDSKLPVGTISINQGAYVTKNNRVTLSLTATDLNGVTDMQFSSNGTTWSEWETFAATKEVDLITGTGAKKIYVRYRDSAGKVSISYYDTINLDTTAPTGLVKINAGATNTKLGSVKLTITGVGTPTKMQFSNDNATWSAWEPFATYRIATWNLDTSTDGLKTVYAQLQDAAGNVSTIEIKDTITLDTTKPTGTVLIRGTEPTNTYTKSAAVTLELTKIDLTVLRVQYSLNSGTTWSSLVAYPVSNLLKVTLPAGSGTKTVQVRYVDAVGLVSDVINDTIILDTVKPVLPVGTKVKVNNDQTIDSSDALWANGILPLTLTVPTPTETGSGLAAILWSHNNVNWYSIDTLNAGDFAISYPMATAPISSTTKTIYVRLKDMAGNISVTYSDPFTVVP